MGRSAMHMLCYCVIRCGTLREVIRRAAEFNEMMEERGGIVGLSEHDNIARFTLEIPGRGRSWAALLIDAVGMYYYYQLFSWLLRRRLPLKEVSFASGFAGRALPALGAFAAALKFNRPTNSLSFPAELLDQKISRSHTDLLKVIDLFPFDMPLSMLSGMEDGAGWGCCWFGFSNGAKVRGVGTNTEQLFSEGRLIDHSKMRARDATR